jgi:hypothetical protein
MPGSSPLNPGLPGSSPLNPGLSPYFESWLAVSTFVFFVLLSFESCDLRLFSRAAASGGFKIENYTVFCNPKESTQVRIILINGRVWISKNQPS